MGSGYLHDISVMLPYQNGGQICQLTDGVLGTGASVPNCNRVFVDKNNVKWATSDYPWNLFKIVDNVATVAVDCGTMSYGIGGMCIDKNNTVWLVDPGSWCIYPIVNGVMGSAVGVNGLGNYNMPSNIWGDKDGALWVLKPDYMDVSRVVKIVNKEVVSVYDLGRGARSIRCDRNNVIYISNYESASISVINKGVVTNISVADFPAELCVDQDNTLWILHINYEDGSSSVSKIIDGVVTRVITSGIGNYPEGICCDDENSIWVSVPQESTLVKIVNGAISLVKDMPNYCTIYGDATGMQSSFLFGDSSPPIVIFSTCQASAGGI